MCNENSECRCISEILKVINILQKKAVRREEETNACDRPMLGCEHFCECNTRPVQLITCGKNGDDPFVMPTSPEEIVMGDEEREHEHEHEHEHEQKERFSSVFRVEKVDDCCCTFRVLKRKHKKEEEHKKEEDEDDIRFIATNSFFTIDLKCVCAIRCLEDTFVECV